MLERRIIFTTSASDDTETYDSLEALRDELRFSAADDYTETVLSQLTAGATHVEIANGNGGILDFYDVTQD